MIPRINYITQLENAIQRSPITALLGPRQCGKTTLAGIFGKDKDTTFFDLESAPDIRRLTNPELMLGSLKGLVVLDEIQLKPELFNVLRVLVDRSDNPAHFLILGSASPHIIKNVSETLAGRVEFIELSGFDLLEIDSLSKEVLWLRGGFPRAFLSKNDDDSIIWREGFIRTFLERDIPQLGITIPAVAMRRFWTMVAHYHGQTWNASGFSKSMGLSDKTVRSYLDILTGTYMIRQLQPWYENIKKRQVKSPKIYLRDSGILHALLNLPDRHTLLGHPLVGASWEGFVIEQILKMLCIKEGYFWSTYSGAEIDLFCEYHGKRYGFEIKLNEAPKISKSMKIAQSDLSLDHLFVIYPGKESYPVSQTISVIPLEKLSDIQKMISYGVG